MNQVSFKGTFINPVNIKKSDGSKYEKFTASFVELEPTNPKDINALEKVHKNWNQAYSSIIYNSAFCSSVVPNKSKHYYALTSQKNNFEHINPDEILGVVEFNKKSKCNRIEFLQVNPKYITGKSKSFISKLFSLKSNENRKLPPFARIGSAILDSLKQLTDKSIDLYSVGGAKGFYRKNGFVRNSILNSHFYIWRKK